MTCELLRLGSGMNKDVPTTKKSPQFKIKYVTIWMDFSVRMKSVSNLKSKRECD